MSAFLLHSCQSLCQLHLGMRLFVFISIQCFFSVFISKVSSCICQPQWKARDTTESGSRFNRFHAISTTRRGVCLPLAEETLSHTGGFLSSWYRPNPASLECRSEWSCRFCSQAFLIFPPAYDRSMVALLANSQQWDPDEVRYSLLSLEKVKSTCMHSNVTKAAFSNYKSKNASVIYFKSQSYE